MENAIDLVHDHEELLEQATFLPATAFFSPYTKRGKPSE
jgi:hypothetical protein